MLELKKLKFRRLRGTAWDASLLQFLKQARGYNNYRVSHDENGN